MKRTRPLPAGGLEQALYDGKRRRRHALAGGGGATAAVVAAVLVAVSLQGSAAKSSLEITNSPEPSVSATGGPVPSPDVSTETSAVPSESDAPDCVNNDCVDQDDSGQPQAVASYAPVSSKPTPDYRESPDSSLATDCAGLSATAEYTYCATGAGPDRLELEAGDTMSVGRRLCTTHTSVNTITLGFSSGQEQDLTVSRRGRVVWRFSKSVHYTQGRHSRTIDRAQCLEWHIDWDGTDQAGRRVPRGDYTLTYTFVPETVNGHATDDEGIVRRDTFGITVT